MRAEPTARARARVAGSLASCAVLCLAPLCLATPPAGPVVEGDVALDYRGLAGCPGEQDFRIRAADAFSFRDPFVAAGRAATFRLRVDISQAAKGYQGTLSVVDPGSGKVLRASAAELHENCDALVWTLAHRIPLAVIAKEGRQRSELRQRIEALERRLDERTEALERRLDRRNDRLEEQNEALQELVKAQAARIARLEQALEEEKKRRMDPTFALAGGALMTAFLTSSVGPGVWAAGEVRVGPLAFGVELRTALPARVVIGGPYDMDLSHYVALVTACGRYSYLFGCAVGGGGAQLEYDSNFPKGPQSGLDALVQLGGRLGVEVPFGKSGLGARGWAEVLYSTPGAALNVPPYRWVRPDVSGFFGLGLVVTFGKGT